MVDPQPVDEPFPHELDHLPRERLEHLGVLHPHACELADVEEPPADARPPVQVEELGPKQRVAPERVLVGGSGHVVRDDVEHDTEPALSGRRTQRAKRLLAAELVRHGSRIDHVVSVRRAPPGPHDGGQVQVGHAQLGQVGDEVRRSAEVQLRA